MTMKSKKYIAGLSFTKFAFLVPISLITWTWAMPLPSIDHEHVGLRNKTTGIIDSLWKCNECEPGMGLSVPCGGIVDIGTVIECVPCKEGETFSDKRDIGQCKPCRICPAFEKKTGKCLVDQDTTQCFCKAGFYRDQLTRACAPCSWCCNDTTNHFVSQCMGNPQGKHCSFQVFKSCSPSTTTATLTTPTTEKSKGSKADLTTAAAGGIYKNSELNATDLLEKRTLETESQDFDWGKKVVLPVGLVIAVIFIVGLSIYFCRQYSKRSNEPHDSALSSTSQSCEEVGDLIAQPLLNPKKLNQRLAEQKPNEAESVRLLPTDAIATFHAVGQASDDTKRVESSSEPVDAERNVRLNQEQLSFISERLGPRVVDLNHTVMCEVSMMLNVQINGKDYRNLDTFCKLDYYYIENFKGKENPMMDIFQIMISQTETLKSFLDELQKISRDDVVQKLFEIATTTEN